MALPKHAIEAIETISLGGEGDEWQKDWDSILEEAWWDAEGPTATSEDLSHRDPMIMPDMVNAGQLQGGTVKKSKSLPNRAKKNNQQGSRSVRCRRHHTLPNNPQPILPWPPVILLPRPPPIMLLPPCMVVRPAYSPYVWFQTPQGFGTFHCFCWNYHSYQQKRMMGKKVL
jgi:hypothetical protein